jgi:hypothetical protein
MCLQSARCLGSKRPKQMDSGEFEYRPTNKNETQCEVAILRLFVTLLNCSFLILAPLEPKLVLVSRYLHGSFML